MKILVLWNWNIWNWLSKNFSLEQKSISKILETKDKIKNVLNLSNLEKVTKYIIDELNEWKVIIWTWYFSEELKYILNEIINKIPEKAPNLLLFWTNWYDVNQELKFSQIVLNWAIKKDKQIDLWQLPNNFWESIFFSNKKEIFEWSLKKLKSKWLNIKEVENEKDLLKAIYLKNSLNIITNSIWVLFCSKVWDSVIKLNELYWDLGWLEKLVQEITTILNSINPWIISKDELLSTINKTLKSVPDVYASSVYLYWDIEKNERKKVIDWDISKLIDFLIDNANKNWLIEKIDILVDIKTKISEF